MGANLKKLNDKHLIFIEEYLDRGNAAEAYRRAYNVDDLIKSQRRGHQLLKDPLINKTISERQKELSEKYNIKKERIIKELVDIIDFNILDVQTLKKKKEIEERLNPLTGEVENVEVEKTTLETNLENLTLSQEKNIKSIEILRNGTVKIQYYDRLDAIEKLNKLLGFYEQTINIDNRIDTSSLQNLSFEDLEKLIKG
jgi:phage terminase small subunit